MRSRLLTIVFALSFTLTPLRSQSTVRTILGAAPDGLQALAATMDTPSAVVSDAAGNIYIALKGAHQVVMLDKTGMVWNVAGTGNPGSSGDGGPAKSALLSNPVGLAFDAAGNLYIADSLAHRIRRVGADGVMTTVAGTGQVGYTGDGGPATKATLNAPSAIVVDRNGNLLIAETGSHVVRMVAPDGRISTFAGIGTKGYVGNDGQAQLARLNSPAGVAVDTAGNVYIADTGNNWIRRVASDGTISLYAGVDTSSSSGSFGPGGGDPTLATNVTLYNPTSLAIDKAANLYLVESSTYRVRRISSDDHISYYSGTGVNGFSGDEGLARYAELNVLGIGLDPQGNLLIADGMSNRVRMVTASDGIINTIAGIGLASYNVRGLAVNGDDIYYSESGCNCVRKLNTGTGVVSLVAGNGLAGFSGDTGTAPAAELNTPRGLSLDSEGNLYIADSLNHRVRRVTASDGKIDTVAGNGTAGTAGDGLSATSAELYEPVAVAVDTAGNYFIAERLGHVVRKVATDGKISTVVRDLSYPQGLALDSTGGLLIADTNNNRIRRLDSSGTLSTLVGASGRAGSTGDGGPAAAAALTGPQAVTVGQAGDIYIGDTGNSRIRRLGADGLITTVSGNGNRGFTGDGSPATSFALNTPQAIVPGSGCDLLIGDTGNHRLRQLSPAIDYTITSKPSGLQVMVDGQLATTPVTVGLQVGTHHRIESPSPQSGSAGTRYVAGSAQAFDVPCGPSPTAVAVSFTVQYSLSIGADDGGTVTSAAAWQDAGASVTLYATPKSGYAFSGWEGDCSGPGACKLSMDGPKGVKANFAPAQAQKAVISSGGVVGAGLSTPPVRALAPNGSAIIFGTGFALAGTSRIVTTGSLVNGKVSTEMDGVCVLVAGIPAPLLALTPAQINFQVPRLPDSSSTTAQVQVVTACGTANESRSDPETVPVQSAAPEFFYFTQSASGRNPVAAIDATTGTLAGQIGLLTGSTFAPARPGDVLTLYATGLGLTSPSFAAGVLPDQAAPIAGDLQVSLGSSTLAQSDILYCGVTPSNLGLYQINIRLPNSIPDGDQPVQVWVNGIASPAGGYITVER